MNFVTRVRFELDTRLRRVFYEVSNTKRSWIPNTKSGSRISFPRISRRRDSPIAFARETEMEMEHSPSRFVLALILCSMTFLESRFMLVNITTCQILPIIILGNIDLLFPSTIFLSSSVLFTIYYLETSPLLCCYSVLTPF